MSGRLTAAEANRKLNCPSCKAFSHLVTDDFTLHGHAQAGDGAVPDRAGGDGLAVLGFGQLVGVRLAAVHSLRGDEAHVAVPARDDGQQLLLGDQVNLVDLLVVPHTDYF